MSWGNRNWFSLVPIMSIIIYFTYFLSLPHHRRWWPTKSIKNEVNLCIQLCPSRLHLMLSFQGKVRPGRLSRQLILVKNLSCVRQAKVVGKVVTMCWWYLLNLIEKKVYSIALFSFHIDLSVEAFRVYFDYPELNQKSNILYELVDTKTITFQTPVCLAVLNDKNHTVPIVVIQDEKIVGKFNYVYLARKCTTSITTIRTILFSKHRADNESMLGLSVTYISWYGSVDHEQQKISPRFRRFVCGLKMGVRVEQSGKRLKKMSKIQANQPISILAYSAVDFLLNVNYSCTSVLAVNKEISVRSVPTIKKDHEDRTGIELVPLDN